MYMACYASLTGIFHGIVDAHLYNCDCTWLLYVIKEEMKQFLPNHLGEFDLAGFIKKKEQEFINFWKITKGKFVILMN